MRSQGRLSPQAQRYVIAFSVAFAAPIGLAVACPPAGFIGAMALSALSTIIWALVLHQAIAPELVFVLLYLLITAALALFIVKQMRRRKMWLEQ